MLCLHLSRPKNKFFQKIFFKTYGLFQATFKKQLLKF